MKFSIETESDQETTEVLAFIKENMMTSARLQRIEATQAEHAARILAVEEALAGFEPGPDLTPQVTALRTDVDAIKAELELTEDAPPPAPVNPFKRK